MKWQHPPIIKIYEALGAVADNRVEVSGNTAKVYSSSGNKFYDVQYDSQEQQIMANDNGSYWKSYLGYPAIAYLMAINTLPYDENAGSLLKGIGWKDINQKFKNDFDKTLDHILSLKSVEERIILSNLTEKINNEIIELNLGYFGKKIIPPAGY